MDKIFFFLALGAMGGVVLSLILGFTAMGGKTDKEHKTSQRMMRMRVMFQALAITFLFFAYLSKH